MPYRTTTIDREFAPGEAAEVTGVSLALQRDWRRREILPANNRGGWARFGVKDIIVMTVLKRFSDGGVSVKHSGDLAHLAIAPTLDYLWQIPGAVEVEDNCGASEGIKAKMLEAGGVVGAQGRYLVACIPEGAGAPEVARFETMANLEKYQTENLIEHFQIVDCWVLAERIFARAGEKPLFRMEIEAAPTQPKK